MGSTKLLTEAFTSTFVLEEDRKTGKMVARGEFGRTDVPTQNGRRYPRAIYEREVSKLQEDIGKRRVLSELDHPQDGKTKLSRAAALITEARVDSDGRVLGAAEILDTPNGRTLAALIRHGVAVGVSSRGFGSTKPAEDGDGEEVCEDFVLRTWDFVADPAMKTAYPEVFAESVGGAPVDIDALREEMPEVFAAIEEGVMDRAMAQVQRANEAAVAAAVEQATQETRDRVERALVQSLRGLREEVEAEVRQQLAEDTAETGAAAVLAQIADMVRPFVAQPDPDHVAEALAQRDAEIQRLSESVQALEQVAREAGYTLLVERLIADHPHAETARALLDDVGSLASAEAVRQRVGEVLESLRTVPVPQAPHEERLARVEADRRRLMHEVKELHQRLAERQTQLTQVVEAGEAMDARRQDAESEVAALERQMRQLREQVEHERQQARVIRHAAQEVAGLANGRELLSLLEGAESVAEVNRVVQERGRTVMADGNLERMRAQLRRGSSDATLLAEDRRQVRRQQGLFSDLGLDLDEQRQLAGLITEEG